MRVSATNFIVAVCFLLALNPVQAGTVVLDLPQSIERA